MPIATFHTQIDLEKLANALEDLGFVREPLTEHGRRTESDRGRATGEEPPWNDAQPEDEADPWGKDEPRQENRSQARSAPRSGGSEGGADSRRTTGRQSSGRSSGGNRQGGSSRSGSSRGSSGGNPDEIPESGQHEDRLGKLWEFGLSDAPECDCRLPAAEVTKPRAKWRAWACPVGFTSNYKNKCDYWEYQD